MSRQKLDHVLSWHKNCRGTLISIDQKYGSSVLLKAHCVFSSSFIYSVGISLANAKSIAKKRMIILQLLRCYYVSQLTSSGSISPMSWKSTIKIQSRQKEKKKRENFFFWAVKKKMFCLGISKIHPEFWLTLLSFYSAFNISKFIFHWKFKLKKYQLGENLAYIYI